MRLKQLLAISILIVHLFNIAGYHIVFNYFIDRSDQQLVKQVDDNHYNDAELIELKMALHLPYMSNSPYAAAEGTVEIDGKHYNYVKRKVWNDTLYVMCLPNEAKTRLHEARNDFAAQAADSPSGKENRTTGKNSQPVLEYNQPILSYNFKNPAQPVKRTTAIFTPQLVRPFIDNSYQPPESFFL